MNRTMIMAAVVLSILTALFVVSMDGADGAVPSGFTEINESNYADYSSTTAPKNIYVNMTDVPERAFENWTTITKVEFSSSVRTIGNYAFYGCTKLLTVTGESVETIGEYAFANSGLMSTAFSTPLTTLGKGCFSDCSALQGPVLTNTSVTVVGIEAFKNSGIVLEDLRKVTEIRQNAFKDTDMKAQILRENQTLVLSGVPEVRVSDIDFLEIHHYKTNMTMRFLFPLDHDFMRLVYWTDGEEQTIVEPVKSSNNYVCSVPYSTSCIHIDALTYTIDYPESLGMTDDTRKCGNGTYTLRTPDGLGSLFSGWNVAGLTGKKTKIYEEDFIDLPTTVVLTPIIGNATLTLDHSAVAETSEYPSLQTSVQFTVGDVYPDMDSLTDFNFLGWTVDGVDVDAGVEITIYSDHTAVSRWENVRTYTVDLIGPEGDEIDSLQVKNGDPVNLSTLNYQEELDECFLGWSATSGGAVLTTNPVVSSDISLYAIITERPQRTLSFMDGDETVGSQNGYEGRTVTITVDDPETEGKIFQYWRLGDSVQKHKGDSVTISGDATLTAVWSTVQVTLTYHTGTGTSSSTLDWGTDVTVGVQVSVPANHVLLGWSKTSEGEPEYEDGANLTVTDDLDLYPIIAENEKFTIVCHNHLGTTSQAEVYSGHNYTIPPNTTEYENHTFLGWSDAEGGQVKYESSATITPDDDMDLYEVWTENERYVVRIHSTTPIVKTAYEGESVEIEFPSMTRDGYTLQGWTDVNGSNIARYEVGQTIIVSSAKEYYPAWKAVESPSSSSGTSHTSTRTSTSTGIRDIPTETGGTPTITVPDEPTTPVVPPIEITFHDGGNITTGTCDQDGVIALTPLEKEGYVFLGWTLEGSDTVLPESFVAEADTDLYAKWAAAEADDHTPSNIVDLFVETDGNDVNPSKTRGGLDTTSITAMVGAGIAAIISVIIVVQMRKN